MAKVIIIGTIGNPVDMEMIRIAIAHHPQIEIVAFNQTESPFNKEPIQFIKDPPLLPKIQILYDKKGKPLPLPKSKFHK